MLPTEQDGDSDTAYIQDLSVKERKVLAVAITSRMMQAYEVSKQLEMASLLGCAKNTISNWGTQGTIPWTMIERCHRDTGKSIEWLLYGKTGRDLTMQQRDKLKKQVTAVFVEGIGYKMIESMEDDAVERLSTKLTEDLIKWWKAEGG